ncbi:hypothetical protein FB451DRAFT_1359102 [Mycena latifolia]|nr:hypothetical protein FB451DRAFT_1359102 [Mycena latifolia]
MEGYGGGIDVRLEIAGCSGGEERRDVRAEGRCGGSVRDKGENSGLVRRMENVRRRLCQGGPEEEARKGHTGAACNVKRRCAHLPFNMSPAASASSFHPIPPDSDCSPGSGPSPRRHRTQTYASAAVPLASGSALAAVWVGGRTSRARALARGEGAVPPSNSASAPAAGEARRGSARRSARGGADSAFAGVAEEVRRGSTAARWRGTAAAAGQYAGAAGRLCVSAAAASAGVASAASPGPFPFHGRGRTSESTGYSDPSPSAAGPGRWRASAGRRGPSGAPGGSPVPTVQCGPASQSVAGRPPASSRIPSLALQLGFSSRRVVARVKKDGPIVEAF